MSDAINTRQSVTGVFTASCRQDDDGYVTLAVRKEAQLHGVPVFYKGDSEKPVWSHGHNGEYHVSGNIVDVADLTFEAFK